MGIVQSEGGGIGIVMEALYLGEGGIRACTIGIEKFSCLTFELFEVGTFGEFADGE